jgi:hypothetical protein
MSDETWIDFGPEIEFDNDKEPLFANNKIVHSRVKNSYGGGAQPEQHNGELVDGRKFFFYFRHGKARLHVALPGHEPMENDSWDLDDVVYDTPYPGNKFIGFFRSAEDRNASFKRCLDQIT